jgi:hypothetical protein
MVQGHEARCATTQQFVTGHKFEFDTEFVTDQCGDEAAGQLLTCNSSEGRDALAEILLVVIQPGTMFAPWGLRAGRWGGPKPHVLTPLVGS